jgi:hypothetical protein
MFSPTVELTLTAEERADLHAIVRATSSPAGLARRARCILLLANGESYSTICTMLHVRDRFISHWKRRYLEGGLLALPGAVVREDLARNDLARRLHVGARSREKAGALHQAL